MLSRKHHCVTVGRNLRSILRLSGWLEGADGADGSLTQGAEALGAP